MTNQKTTAKITGLLYLGLGITGMLGFLTIRPALYDPADAAMTLANLIDNEGLARLGIALELGVVLTQALVAMAFFRLFRSEDSFSAGAVAVFGMMNAVAILISTIVLTVALKVALNPMIAPAGEAAGTAQMMYALSSAAWSCGSLFFGLWLIPMGQVVLKSGLMPRMLGYVLVAGGIGYVLSTFVTVLLPGIAGTAGTALSLLATVGEFWMIGYLLIFGVRSSASEVEVSAFAKAA